MKQIMTMKERKELEPRLSIIKKMMIEKLNLPLQPDNGGNYEVEVIRTGKYTIIVSLFSKLTLYGKIKMNARKQIMEWI